MVLWCFLIILTICFLENIFAFDYHDIKLTVVPFVFCKLISEVLLRLFATISKTRRILLVQEDLRGLGAYSKLER